MALRGPSRRDDRFDFLRGLALLVIFIDHVPKNLFEAFTLHSVAFCDAAEVFFFISGYVAALVYGRKMLRDGFVAATRKVWRRASVVYGAQMFLLFAVLALVWVFLHATGDETYRWMFRIQYIFEDPLGYILPALTMHYQPGYLDILPAYVVLLALFPVVLWGLNRNVWLVAVPSFALWLAVQTTGLTFWTTSGDKWFFNPFAWQFIFVIGAVFGHPAMQGKFAFLNSKWLLRAAFVVAIPGAFVQISDTLRHYVWWVVSLRPNTVLLDKTALGALRLVSFFALALIARAYLPANGVFTAHRWCQPVLKCGRFSLQVFSFGALLSSVTAVTWILFGNNIAVQSLAVVIGVVLQFAYAAWKDQRRQKADEKKRAEPARDSLMLSAAGGEPVPVPVHSEAPLLRR
jgi:hypothetical protein